MRRRVNKLGASGEIEVRITWHQWHDGRWEAWVTDESGRPPHRVRDRAELEQFLSRAYGRGNRRCRAGSDPDGS